MNQPNPALSVDVCLQGEALEPIRAIALPEDWQAWLHAWLSYLSPDVSPINAYELSLQFTSDEAIAALNGQYRQQRNPTDVLSFAALEGQPLPVEVLRQIPCNLGDIIVSVETAQNQCHIHGHSFKEELIWLASHGLLHLLGWDHPDEPHLQRMLSMQWELLQQIGLELKDSAYRMNV